MTAMAVSVPGHLEAIAAVDGGGVTTLLDCVACHMHGSSGGVRLLATDMNVPKLLWHLLLEPSVSPSLESH